MGSFSFEDLCGQCVANNLVFPALEAFEQRLDNPTNYYLFYEYFLSAAVGEEEWKQKKQRKVVKELKVYTGIRVGGEKAYKGWSARAFVELLEVKTAILADKVRYKRFEKAYKRLYSLQRVDDIAQAQDGDTNSGVMTINNDQYNQLFAEDDDEESDDDSGNDN